VFENATKDPIECQYKFPLESTFTVSDVEITVGDITINAEIMEKKKAAEKYDDSIAQGRTAMKVSYDEELPDVLNLNIGSVQPESTATIIVTIHTKLEVIKPGFWSLIFPVDFIPSSVVDEETQETKHINAQVSAEFEIISTSKLTNLNTSHPMEFERLDGCTKVKLSEISKLERKDIVVSYSTDEIRQPQVLIHECEQHADEVAVNISFIPRISEENTEEPAGVEEEKGEQETEEITETDADQNEAELANGEFVFVIDRKGVSLSDVVFTKIPFFFKKI
jgi:hypothetical protein